MEVRGTAIWHLVLFQDLHCSFAAVDANHLSGRDVLRPERGAGDGGEAVLPAHDRRMAHHSTDVGDGSPDLVEHRRPRWGCQRRHQNLAFLDLADLIG